MRTPDAASCARLTWGRMPPNGLGSGFGPWQESVEFGRFPCLGAPLGDRREIDRPRAGDLDAERKGLAGVPVTADGDLSSSDLYAGFRQPDGA